MGAFKPIPGAEYRALCTRAANKVSSMAMVASTLEPGSTALVEESLLAALRTLSAWGGQNG